MWRMERYLPVGWTNPSQAITFQVLRENTNSKTRENIKMADSVLLLLELFDDSEVEYAEISRKDDDLIFFFSVASCYMRRNLNRMYEYNTTVFSRRIQEFFRMTRETCKLFTHEVMPTERIPLGNRSGRAPIPPTKQVLWSMANQEPTRAVAAKFDITLSSVDWVLKRVSQAAVDLSGRFIRWPNVEFQWLNITTKGQICWVAGVAAMLTVSIQASEKLGLSRNGRKEQNFPVIPIFRNIGLSWKVFLNFLKFFPGFFRSIVFLTGNLGHFDWMESAPTD